MSEVTFLVLKVSAKGACVTTTCEILGNSVPVEAFVAPVSAYATGIKLSDSLTKVVTLLFFLCSMLGYVPGEHLSVAEAKVRLTA